MIGSGLKFRKVCEMVSAFQSYCGILTFVFIAGMKMSAPVDVDDFNELPIEVSFIFLHSALIK